MDNTPGRAEAIPTMNFEAIKTSMRQNKDGTVLTLLINPVDVPKDLMVDWIGSRYTVVMVKLDEEDQPAHRPEMEAAKRAVAQAHLLCQEESFITWIGARNPEEAAEKLKQTLGIESRSVIAVDDEIRKRFRQLVTRFKNDLGAKNGETKERPGAPGDNAGVRVSQRVDGTPDPWEA